MTKGTSEPGVSGSGGFHAVHAERDLESNWEVDLAKKLEEYLLKICSGEITGEEEGLIPINFAEAALLLQGSIQVYSRKVEYLYTLVLRALEFLSQKRQQDHIDGASVQPEESGPHAVANEENDQFWGLDDIPVEEKNSLDGITGKEVNLDHFIKPPANLVVLEGDCLDAGGDGGELESFLLSTTDLYQDFILLDTSDAVAVDEFLKGSKAATTKNNANKGTSIRKSFLSPVRTGGSACRLSAAKSHCANSNCSPELNCGFDDENVRPSSPPAAGLDDCNYGVDMEHGCDASRDSDNSDDDNDDPWKLLNPHEPGNLRVKPFRKGKALKKSSINLRQPVPMSTLFPLAKLHGPVSPELMEMWEMQHHVQKQKRDSQAPLYEKLRQSLVNEGNETGGTFFNTEADNDDSEYYDSGNPDFDMPDNAYMEEDPPFSNEHEFNVAHVNTDDEAVDLSQASLEDLCRSHLNALLASIAETENQTEMAARVSTWKQRIEHNLEEQESHPPFDIQDCGERILDKFSLLSLDASSSSVSFSDLVKGQEKYDVARSFSSLLQLVNNGDVALERNGVDASVCYTSVNPFHVRLLKRGKEREGAQLRLPKKRGKSRTRKPSKKGDKNKTEREKSPSNSSKYGSTGVSPPTNCKFSLKLGKVSARKLSPETKRRRRSQYVEPVNLHSAG